MNELFQVLKSILRTFSFSDPGFLLMWLIAGLFLFALYSILQKNEDKVSSIKQSILIITGITICYGFALTGNALESLDIPHTEIPRLFASGVGAIASYAIWGLVCFFILDILEKLIPKS